VLALAINLPVPPATFLSPWQDHHMLFVFPRVWLSTGCISQLTLPAVVSTGWAEQSNEPVRRAVATGQRCLWMICDMNQQFDEPERQDRDWPIVGEGILTSFSKRTELKKCRSETVIAIVNCSLTRGKSAGTSRRPAGRAVHRLSSVGTHFSRDWSQRFPRPRPSAVIVLQGEPEMIHFVQKYAHMPQRRIHEIVGTSGPPGGDLGNCASSIRMPELGSVTVRNSGLSTGAAAPLMHHNSILGSLHIFENPESRVGKRLVEKLLQFTPAAPRRSRAAVPGL
jgi:hypothetical protein